MAKYWKQFTRFFKIYFDIAMSHVQRTEGQQRQALHVWPVRLRLVNQPGARGIRDNYYGSAGDCAADSSCVCESINCFLPRGENKGTVKKCTGDSLNPRNTCFKTVNKKTGGLSLNDILLNLSLQHDNAEFYMRWYCWPTVTIKRLTLIRRPCSFSLESHLWNQYCKYNITAISI